MNRQRGGDVAMGFRDALGRVEVLGGHILNQGRLHSYTALSPDARLSRHLARSKSVPPDTSSRIVIPLALALRRLVSDAPPAIREVRGKHIPHETSTV